MALSDLTELRSPTGPRRLQKIKTGDLLLDRYNQAKKVIVGNRVPLFNPHRVSYPPRGRQHCQPQDYKSVVMSGHHPLPVRASKQTTPRSGQNYGHPNVKMYVRCTARDDAVEAAEDAGAGRKRTRSRHGAGRKRKRSRDGFESDDEALRYHLKVLNSRQRCTCGGVHISTVSCDTKAIAEELVRMAESRNERLPQPIVLPGDEISITAADYAASPHCGDNPPVGTTVTQALLKVFRVPFEQLEQQSRSQRPRSSRRRRRLPLDPWWLGLWLGDGTQNRTTIATTDPEIFAKIKRYVARLNRTRPAHAAKLKASYYQDKNCGKIEIVSSGRRRGKKYWNPVRDGLKELGLLGSHKVNGIPKDYRDADQSVTAPLLAGLFDADGSIDGGGYAISQVVDPHERIMRHACKMGKGMGMRVSMNPYTPKGANPTLVAYFSGPQLELLQPHLACSRKKRPTTMPYLDHETRPIHVEQHDWAGDWGRSVRFEGERESLFQLPDGYVVRGDEGGEGSEDDGGEGVDEDEESGSEDEVEEG